MGETTSSLYVFNSLSGKKDLFVPITDKHIGMYVCGPTVYSNVHLGNCRTFISFDLIFRYLKHIGYNVRYVRNITDVGHLEFDEDDGEDRISKKARLESIEPMEVVQRYTTDFHKILDAFNTLPPSIEPTATGHIVEQIEHVKKIIDRVLFLFRLLLRLGRVAFNAVYYIRNSNLSTRCVEAACHVPPIFVICNRSF